MSSAIFDLDGVLVDSSALYAEVIGEVLGRAGYEVSGREIVAARVPHVPGWVGGILPAGAPVGRLADEVRAGVAGQSGDLAVRPATADALARLAGSRRLFLLTNSTARYAGAILDRHGLAHLFERVVTSDDGFASKAAAIIRLLHEHGEAVADAVYVGDTLADVSSAREAGCRVVILYSPWSWDHGRLEEIEEAGPDAVASDLGQVAEIMEKGWP